MDYEQYEEQDYEYKGDEEWGEERQEFQTERKGFERGGGGIRIDVNLRMISNPYEKFRIISTAVMNKINSHYPSSFSMDDFGNISDKISSINFIEYKNPSAYVLGYYVTRGGREDVIEDRLERVDRNFLDVINETRTIVTIIDVIRYGAFWREVLF